jgi:hypothetical protein
MKVAVSWKFSRKHLSSLKQKLFFKKRHKAQQEKNLLNIVRLYLMRLDDEREKNNIINNFSHFARL